MTQIVVLDGFTENPGDLSWAGLEALGQLRVYPRTKPEEIIPRIGQADIVYTNKTPITRETLLACPSIRMVSVLATGYNVVDVAACQELGILVTNIPTYGTTAVAQFTIALLLEICHQIGHHSQAVHQGRWTSSPDWCFWDYPLMELAGKTLGIIGMGRIGQIRTVSAAQLAAQCQSTLNAKVKYVDAGRPINTLAVLGGSGDHLIEEAVAAGADALLTGEAGHHDALDAKRLGLSLIVAGHYATEFPVVPVLADKLSRRFAGVRVLCSRRNREPFTYL